MSRLWLDSIEVSRMAKAYIVLKKKITAGFILVTDENILDMKIFQENLDWLKKNLLSGHILIEKWESPKKMTEHPFFWSSVGIETPASNSFEEAIAKLPNRENILTIKDLIDDYAIPKDTWFCRKNVPKCSLTNRELHMLKLQPSATRTEILNACQLLKHFDIFESYNQSFSNSCAVIHQCHFKIESNGIVRYL